MQVPEITVILLIYGKYLFFNYSKLIQTKIQYVNENFCQILLTTI